MTHTTWPLKAILAGTVPLVVAGGFIATASTVSPDGAASQPATGPATKPATQPGATSQPAPPATYGIRG